MRTFGIFGCYVFCRNSELFIRYLKCETDKIEIKIERDHFSVCKTYIAICELR